MWTLTHKILAVTALALLISTTAFAALWRHEQGQKKIASLRADSAVAAADTTKQLFDTRLKHDLADSAQIFQRRVVQADVTRLDQFAKDLKKVYGQVQTLQGDITASIRQGYLTGTGLADSTGRVARFDIYQQPFKLLATARLPVHQEPTLNATITVDPAHLGVRLTCGASLQGIRQANVYLTGPPWITLKADTITQDPSICNSKAMDQLAAAKDPWWKPHLSIFAGGGYDPLDRKVHPVVGVGFAKTF